MDNENNISFEEAKHILSNGFGKVLQEIAALYTIPICFIRADNGRPLIVDNGSAFLLNAGKNTFLVTASHVYRGFCTMRENHSDTICLLGEMHFPLENKEKLISEDTAYDVATFNVTENEIACLKNYGKVLLTVNSGKWPPTPPEIEKGVFFVGFPGDGRKILSWGRTHVGNSTIEIDWTGYTGLTIASGVSNTDITLLLEHDPEYDIGLRPQAPPDWALGGCSGAPILTLVLDKGIYSWRLGGIIYEAPASYLGCKTSLKMLKASRADCLNSDGSINGFPDLMAYRVKPSFDNGCCKAPI